MWALIGLFAGALVGHALWGEWGAAFGAIAGFITGAKLGAGRRPVRPPEASVSASPTATRIGDPYATERERALLARIDTLEQRVATLERALHGDAVPTRAQDAPPIPAADVPSAATLERTDADAALTAPPQHVATEEPPARAVPQEPAPPAPPSPPSIEVPHATAAGTNPLWAWFTGGNALTRIGVVVLFVGVAFLLRYFSERFSLSIELRLAAVAAFGGALLFLGARFARTRPGYGLSLEGAGAGILYLTIYAAFGLYGVLPALPAIALLVVVSALTIALAVRHDSQPLAALAIAGGFLAPILVARDHEPVYVLSWFAILNGAIFALAWKRAWRALNAVGFVFTFGLAAFWGHGYYRPQHFAIVEPFLLAFVAFYIAIAILYARRGPLAAKDPVDGLLVFGVPLVAFALQAALVRDLRYGAAWSALVLSIVYAVLYFAVRRRPEPGLELLSRAFLALAAIFATITVPFVFDRRATAALWAMEAAGVYWIGVAQSARMTRLFALAIEIAAGIVFIASGIGSKGAPLFANAFFAGALLIALSGFATARLADRASERLSAVERGLTPLVFAWGVAWWIGGGAVDLVRHLARPAQAHAVLSWVVSGVALALLFTRFLRWPRLAAAGVALLPAMALVAALDLHQSRTTLLAYGWMLWPLAWALHWGSLRAADGWLIEGGTGSANLATAHSVSALALTAQVCWEASEWTGRNTDVATIWTPCAAALPAIAFLWLCLRCAHSLRWPANPYRDAYAKHAGGAVAFTLALWFFLVNALSPGDMAPLPYLPIVNPLDLTLALALWALVRWGLRFTAIAPAAVYRWAGIAVFVALNALVLRSAHHWAGIPWRLSSLLASKPLQAALTLTWTATALALMVGATRRALRPLWMLGAALLAAVVVKLFVVDLGTLSGLPRVVAFLGVGVLLLVIGYLSPLPPASKADVPEGGAQ